MPADDVTEHILTFLNREGFCHFPVTDNSIGGLFFLAHYTI